MDIESTEKIDAFYNVNISNEVNHEDNPYNKEIGKESELVIESSSTYLGEENLNSPSEDVQDKLTTFELAELLGAIDYGCYMNIKKGTTGLTPDQDSFPYFKSEKKWIQLLWHEESSKWRIGFFTRQPDEVEHEDPLHAVELYDTVEAWSIQDITEVYIELEPSTSWRLYKGETLEVMKLTPANRAIATAWTDAIFAAMQLQTRAEEKKLLASQVDPVDHTGDDPMDQNHDPSEVIFIEDFEHLREHYWNYKFAIEENNPMAIEDDHEEGDIEGGNPTTSSRSKVVESVRLSFSSLYSSVPLHGHSDIKKEEPFDKKDGNPPSCCIIV